LPGKRRQGPEITPLYSESKRREIRAHRGRQGEKHAWLPWLCDQRTPIQSELIGGEGIVLLRFSPVAIDPLFEWRTRKTKSWV
jgi:hypothetical protein